MFIAWPVVAVRRGRRRQICTPSSVLDPIRRDTFESGPALWARGSVDTKKLGATSGLGEGQFGYHHA
jgi:hypothetical protein